MLALLSSKVLGQFDPFTPQDGYHGRLLLVAPNVLHHERKLKVDSSDFRLWVALHEQTHAMQFAAAPWLAEHLRSRASELLADLTGEGARAGPAGVGDARAGRRRRRDPRRALAAASARCSRRSAP